ncbi:MAG: tetratricopeptide repeat protein [Lentimicrobium sp.]|nr:tetratricopeptide repeat protein [Lentimicrobium sp.]
MKKFKKFLLVVILIVTVNGVKIAPAQTVEEATNAYNTGVGLAATDMPKAIQALLEAADIAEKAGPDAAEVLNLSKQQIPLLQYNFATSLYKDKKVDEAISNFEQAHSYAVQFNDDGIKGKVEELLPKLYRVKGNGEYKAEKYDEALASFDKALEFYPDFAGAWLSKGLVYNKQNKTDDLRIAMDKAIETGTKINDEKTVEQASKFMSDNFINSANGAFKKNDFEKTVSLLDESLKYVQNNAEAYYLYALSFNKLSKFDEAIASALKGIELDGDTPGKQARFHFEIGTAQAGKGSIDDACASFKKAAIGPLAESANYQIKTVLKCS